MSAPFHAGQRVRVIGSDRFSGLATVSKVLPKNVDIVLDDGRKVRCHPLFLVPETALIKVDVPQYVPPPAVGTIVTSNNPQIVGPHIVLGETTRNRAPRLRIVKLGGDDGRTWTVPVSMVTIVPLADLPALL